MSFALLVILVVAGIAVIVLAVHLTGGSRNALLRDAAHARSRFAEDFPDAAVAGVHLCTSGEAAFLELRDGRLGIVQSLGDRFLTRILRRAEILEVDPVDDVTFSVRFRDFTWPRAVFRFADSASARRIVTVLAAERVHESLNQKSVRRGESAVCSPSGRLFGSGSEAQEG